ncbi:hypothetical protein KK083_06005 [Fulvivirgaceae bacterium PWU4]|uniref:Uncharacterized protein n=1 Tax=Chryseosolibacter histidini TaxID=2782349 RepID=A0AAP2DLY8_9BACT|nr:hypothetical protein [Chryseosolibacter histidini]MBT1696419.1 hypothetical protein [Chryseosolibacter histidini]
MKKIMNQGKRSLPQVDYVTILIILVFLAMALGVFFYYRNRLNMIQEELRQTGFQVEKKTGKMTANL